MGEIGNKQVIMNEYEFLTLTDTWRKTGVISRGWQNAQITLI